MTSFKRAHIRRLCFAVLALLCIAAALAVPRPAEAAPKPSAVQTFSVEASATSVGTTSAVGYTVTVRMRQATPSLRVRLRIYTSGGWLLYQKTEYVTVKRRGAVRVSVARGDTEPPMEPGLYRVEISVKSSDMFDPLSQELPLRVFEEGRSPVPVVIALRVGGAPMTDPQGRFVVDPAEPNAAFDAAVGAAALVLGDVRVRLSLALPPVLLSEWGRAAAGYELVDETGITSVATGTPTPARYANGLARLRAAAATGRLEVLTMGYADPNLAWLSREGLVTDILPQYLLGARDTSASIGTTIAAGTSLAGSSLPSAAGEKLVDAGIRWAVFDQGAVGLGDANAPSGAYRTKWWSMRAVVADSVGSKALRSGETSVVITRAFERFVREDNKRVRHDSPYVVSLNAGPGAGDLSGVSELVNELATTPWAKLSTTRQALFVTSSRQVALRSVASPDRAPAGYWDEVRKARQSARSLAAALGPTSPDALKADLDGLTAESAGWAGADRSWALADRGRTYSAAANRRFKVILGRVKLSAPDVTLAGSAGEVPVTITNPTRRVLRVVFIALDTGRVVRVGGRRELLLRPGDTYLTLKVDLRTSLSNSLQLAVRAGGADIDTETVVIRASYLDRLAIVGGVFLFLGGVLVFIVRRVRAAERSADTSIETSSSVGPEEAAAEDEAEYTERSSGDGEPGVSDTP